MLGFFCFMAMMLWWASALPTLGTVLMYLFSALLTVILFQLYFTQLVLFRQSPLIRLRNALLFTIQNFWRVMGTGLLQVVYWGLCILFAPWSLLVLPILGVWYILFLTEHLLYDRLNTAFSIEESFNETSQ